MGMSADQEVRLAMREETDFWVAYFAPQGSMDGAMEIGRIRMRLVMRPDRKHGFMQLMQDAMTDMIEDVSGHRPQWNGPVAAPAFERGVVPK